MEHSSKGTKRNTHLKRNTHQKEHSYYQKELKGILIMEHSSKGTLIIKRNFKEYSSNDYVKWNTHIIKRELIIKRLREMEHSY